MVGYAEHASWKLDMPLGSMDVIGLWDMRTLSGWGARYTAKKARR